MQGNEFEEGSKIPELKFNTLSKGKLGAISA